MQQEDTKEHPWFQVNGLSLLFDGYSQLQVLPELILVDQLSQDILSVQSYF